ncbi:cation:proton antiporter [Xinfangfangia sp. D13-10-4-6]|uniref:monovalent cation/H(+) antiporter subunit G n=1 Tax=Pseudogemmobacter hezensis TaxID=2737662 RepID=UPI001551CD1D|nr:monovalent cation/H(+) antiporter subunit G [Pseudogemmobacter hezensis]NPD14175.1 cation:proton antiporter [Pseudogemmobacter hezensis]
MSYLDTLPPWIAIPVAFFLILGSTLTLLGAFGLARLRDFYDRLHAPTLGTSWGAAGILLASMILMSWNESEPGWSGLRPVLHELVIGIFLMITTPVTLMLLGRAALHRDRIEGTPGIPGAVERADVPHRPTGEEADGEAAPEIDISDAPGEN